MTGFSKEMQDALRADAEKLSAMTGEEHTVEFFSAPWDSEPVAWRVMAGPNFRPFHCSSRADAEQVAHNYLTYVRGCASARIEPLYAGQPETIQPRVYGITPEQMAADSAQQLQDANAYAQSEEAKLLVPTIEEERAMRVGAERRGATLRQALRDIIDLDHHNMGPESRATQIARRALNEEQK